MQRIAPAILYESFGKGRRSGLIVKLACADFKISTAYHLYIEPLRLLLTLAIESMLTCLYITL